MNNKDIYGDEFMLKYVRLSMFIVISYIYYTSVPEKSLLLKYYAIIAILLFITNHFIISTGKHYNLIKFSIMLDLAITFSYGYLFPQSTIYLILVGISAITVFTTIYDRRMFQLLSPPSFLLWFGALIHTYYVTGKWNLVENLINILFILFSCLIGNLLYKLRLAQQTMSSQFDQLDRSHISLKEAHDQLMIYSSQIEEMAIIQERNRMASEIHDTVGHKMTALIVQLQLLQELLKNSPEQTKRVIETCTELARMTLQEVRLSVRTLQSDQNMPHSLASLIRKLAEEFYHTTGVQTEIKILGDPSIIPIFLQPMILQTIQESLTNAKRHGNAKHCWIQLTCTSTELKLHLKDNGVGTLEFKPGFGLMNMKNRIEDYGGSIYFESNENSNFIIQISIPLQEKIWMIGDAK